jgi:hypothetical protein
VVKSVKKKESRPTERKKYLSGIGNMDAVAEFEMGGNGNSSDEGEEKVATYLPGQPLKEDEELVCDESVYVMLHEVHTGKNAISRD